MYIHVFKKIRNKNVTCEKMFQIMWLKYAN